jgi:hypothetical protein
MLPPTKYSFCCPRATFIMLSFTVWDLPLCLCLKFVDEILRKCELRVHVNNTCNLLTPVDCHTRLGFPFIDFDVKKKSTLKEVPKNEITKTEYSNVILTSIYNTYGTLIANSKLQTSTYSLLTFNDMCHRNTKACIQTDKPSVSSVCGQEVTACFTPAPVKANSLPTKCFSRGGPKRQRSLTPILVTWILTATTGDGTGQTSYRSILELVVSFCLDLLRCTWLANDLQLTPT